MTLVAPVVARIGGMERVMTELAEGLLQRGHEVTVIAHTVELADHPRLRRIKVRAPNRPAALAYPWFVLAATIQARRHARGILHTQGVRIAGRAHIATVHFCHHAFRENVNLARRRRDTLAYRANEWLDGAMNRVAERFAYRPERITRLITVAHGVRRELERFFPAMAGRIDVIPNGVDLDTFKPDERARETTRHELGIPPEARLAVFVGGDWERKGLRYAVHAVASVPGWSLLVVGEGNERHFSHVAAQAGAAVHFAGRQRDPQRYMTAGDAFVFPSAYEAFPLVVLEAAAVGLPLLVTRGNGTEELVMDGENGYFVERDGPDIAAALRRLDQAEEGGRSLGMAARRAVEPYVWPAIVDRHVAVYADLIEEAGR